MSDFLNAGLAMGQRKYVRFSDHEGSKSDPNAHYCPQGSSITGTILAHGKRQFSNGNVRPVLTLDAKEGLLEVTLAYSLFTAVVEAVGKQKFKVDASGNSKAIGVNVTIKFVDMAEVDGYNQYTFAVTVRDDSQPPF